ncbi:MAG: hypothetical protein U1F49_15485 [Rubrivivax sp.]
MESRDEFTRALDEPWDVVLSTTTCPGSWGLQALADLRERGIDLPFILVSGMIGEDHRGGSHAQRRQRITC